MPLSEMYWMAKGKFDSTHGKNASCSNDQSFAHENDLAELVWENGQITTQGQSNRARKNPPCCTVPSYSLPSHEPKHRDRNTGNGFVSKNGKFGTSDAVVNDFPLSLPSAEIGLTQDDDEDPWLSYAMDETLQDGYGSDFLAELSGVTVNELSAQNNFLFFDKGTTSNRCHRDSRSHALHNGVELEQHKVLRVSLAEETEKNIPKTGPPELHILSSQQCQADLQTYTTRVTHKIDNTTTNSPYPPVSGESVGPSSSADGLPGKKLQRQDPEPSGNSLGLMNFSHFLRPVALLKANLQNIGAVAASGLSTAERIESQDKWFNLSTCSSAVSTLVGPSSSLQKDTHCHGQPVSLPSRGDSKPVERKPPEESLDPKPSVPICQEDALKSQNNSNEVSGESASGGMPDGERRAEPIVASSSVCSGNSVERASNDPTLNLKRKFQDTEDSECPSEDVEAESAGVKKGGGTRGGTGSKRSRAAEVHNLSERRRRDRINEKMRALQELIPNCNKVDKASMLDEAIEYLKTLQLQVQIMSMGTGLYMPPMMFPTSMQHIHPAHMAHFSSMGVGVGMGVSFGTRLLDIHGVSSSFPMVNVPSMQGAHYPSPPIPGPTSLQGMTQPNLQMYGLPNQGLSMPIPCTPYIPLSAGSLTKPSMRVENSQPAGPMEKMGSTSTSPSMDPMQQINSQIIQGSGVSSSLNQTTQCQATKEGFQQTTLVENSGHALDANVCEVFDSVGATNMVT